MTTIALPLESDNIGPNLDDKSSPESETEKIELNLPNNTREVLLSSSQGITSENPTENVTQEIPVTENKISLNQKEENTIVNSEDEPKVQTSTNSSDNSCNNKHLETAQNDETSNSTSSAKGEIEGNLPSQQDKEDFSKEEGYSSNSSGNSNSQKASQEKVDEVKSNEPKINRTDGKILSSNEDDDYTSFKLNKGSKSGAKKMFTIVDSESEDEPKVQSSTDSSDNSCNNKHLETAQNDETSNSTSSAKGEIHGNLPSQQDKEDFLKEGGSSSNSSGNSNSQKASQEKVDEVKSNEPKINRTDDKILSSDEDDDYTSFKLNKGSKSGTKKMFAIVDSESDDEGIFTSKKENKEKDKEETGSVSETENGEKVSKYQKKSRLTNILDLDSESGDENFYSAESSNDEKKKMIQTKKTSNVLKNLVDSDDSEPDERKENDRTLSDGNDENETEGNSKDKSEKKRSGSARAAKDAAMKEIHSESQRLLRESELSLPYHRPKQRTLQEFLNRKKISTSLPKAPTTAAKVKMFADIISKAVEEKEKEVEEFYKSSDSEEETQLPNKKIDGIEKTKDSTDQNLDLKELDSSMEVDPSKKNEQLLISLDVPEILPSNNLNSTEEVAQVPQIEDIEDIMTETAMECSIVNNSSVSRKLFMGEDENENYGTNHESQKDCETVQNLEDQNDAENSDDDNPMETDTNDFELRFSTADFDTNLKLIGLESSGQESVPSSKMLEDEKTDENESKGSETAISEEEKNVDRNENEKTEDELAAGSSKGHVIGLPPPDLDDSLPKKTLKNKIPSSYLKGKPSLRGTPGTNIDFEVAVKSHRNGISSLVDRFVRHSQTPKSEKIDDDVMVMHTEVTTDGLKLTETVLPYKRMNAAEDHELNKPGAKLKKLREELEQKMSSKRNEEWRQKEEASKALDEYLGEEIEPEDKDELLLDDEEELDEESAESEPEENDVIIKENKKSNCEFADEEAEVSEDEETIVDGEREDEEYEEEEELEEDNAREADDEEEDEDEESKDAEELEHPKKLRRITTAFEDDSNPSEPESPEKEANSFKEDNEDSRKKFQRTKTDVDMFGDVSDGWTSESEDEMHPKMRERASLTCQTPVLKPNHLSLISPITQLSALNKNSDSGMKNLASKGDSLDQMNDSLSQEPTSVEKRSQTSLNLDKLCGLQKKLFQDSPDTVNVDELMDLCSGNFSDNPVVRKDLQHLMNPPTQSKVTDSQLLDLCSGSFSSVPLDKESEKAFGMDEDSQDMKLTLDEESTSPTKASPKKMGEVTLLGSRLKVVSTDEEDEVEKEEKDKRRKKKIQKLVLSDDEDENDATEGTYLSEEEDEEEEVKEEEEEQFIDYDSEENEVVMIPKKDLKKVAKNFLENEAELSESDWDSADEDEKGLDRLEREEGDEDVIDEERMRNQIGKLHARQVLDDDQREVRLLQDMLFEDGDLHSEGAGRERKFKWKNIDTLDVTWDETKGPEDQEMIAEAMEDTSEIELRKRRFEQQQFLEKQKQNSMDDIVNDLNDSPIFKVGLKVVKTVKCSTSFSKTEESLTMKSKKPLAPSIIPNLLEKPAIVKNFTIQHSMRGSFLARGEADLARIASIIDEKDKVVRAPVNGRRFVFEHISPSVKDAEEMITCEEVSTPNKKSRKRTSTSDSTPKSTKKLKADEDRSAGKRLFNP